MRFGITCLAALALAGIEPAAAQAQEANPSGIFIIKATPAETGLRASVVEQVTQPGLGPPYHVHTREDEIFYVIDGQMRFWRGDETFVAGPGTVVMLPRRVPHTFRNAGDTSSRIIFNIVPDGLEKFFEWRDEENPSPEEIEKVAREKFGLFYLGPPPEE